MRDEPRLAALFRQHYGMEAEHIAALKASASARRIYRLAAGSTTAIGVINDDTVENRVFLTFTEWFRGADLPVPEVYCTAPDGVAYLEEDLGDATLYDVLSSARTADDAFPSAVERLYAAALRTLPHFQHQAARGFDFSVCHPRRAHDRDGMLADLDYFETAFLQRLGLSYEPRVLHADFAALADHLASADLSWFVYRDFQARNIMVRDGRLGFIDYQGGRQGALQYDVVSLLYQARAGVPEASRARLLDVWLEAASDVLSVSRERFCRHLPGFVLIRLLQTLGTYGKVGLGGHNSAFVTVIPTTLGLLRDALAAPPVPLPAIREMLERVEDCLFSPKEAA